MTARTSSRHGYRQQGDFLELAMVISVKRPRKIIGDVSDKKFGSLVRNIVIGVIDLTTATTSFKV